jgi:hypothetical protein
MGMISEELFRNFNIMREIRNRFAHDTEISSFEISEIRDRCLNFRIVVKYVFDSEAGLHGHPSAVFLYETRGA